MGQLSGFKYVDVIRKLSRLGFHFDRQAKGSHEFWCNATGKVIMLPKHKKDI